MNPDDLQGGRRDRQGQHRRIGRVDLAVGGRHGKVGRQQVAARVDGGLHLLLGNVQRDIQRKPQRDDRRAARTGGRHLREPRHLAKLALHRRGDGGRHHIRAGAWVQRGDLNGGVVHLGQGRQRQQPVSQRACDQDGDHQQRRGDRAQDEEAGNVHARAAGRVTGFAAAGAVRATAGRTHGVRPGSFC